MRSLRTQPALRAVDSSERVVFCAPNPRREQLERFVRAGVAGLAVAFLAVVISYVL